MIKNLFTPPEDTQGAKKGQKPDRCWEREPEMELLGVKFIFKTGSKAAKYIDCYLIAMYGMLWFKLVGSKWTQKRYYLLPMIIFFVFVVAA